MASEVAWEYPHVLRVYKDGRVERLRGTEIVPPRHDSETGIRCMDVVFSPEKRLSARFFLPSVKDDQTQKLPLVIYIHGGAFCIESPFSSLYYDHLVPLCSRGNVMIVAIEYRRAPESVLPAAYEDSWEAIQWVASHTDGEGPHSWINRYADLEKVFFVGDSAGGNIVHTMGIRASTGELPAGFKLRGMVFVHPYFEDGDEARLKILDRIYPTMKGWDDPMINPVGAGAEHLASLKCSKVLVCVAGDDRLVGNAGVKYYEGLKNSGWEGGLQLMVSEGEDHIFHLKNPKSEKAKEVINKVVAMIHNAC